LINSVKDSDAEPVGVEDILRRSHEVLLKVLNSLDAIVYVTDIETNELLFVNKYTRDIFGDIEGLTCWQTLQVDQTGPCEFCSNEKLVDKSGNPIGVYHWEFQNTINGRWYDIKDRAIEWVDDRIVRLEIAYDITDRKIVEEDVIKHSIELKEANKLKDLFTDVMTHDLLNPVGIIRGVAESALLDSPGNKELEMIKRNAERLVETIENANKLSKLKSIEDLEKKTLDLKKIIETSIKNNKPLFDSVDMYVENRIKIKMPIKANKIIGDVFLNLLTNAAKYAHDDKIVLEAKENKKTYRVLVKDNGPGVEDEYKKDIFNRFSRRAKGGVVGTGLGLTIANKIVQMHNGRIWVEDNPEGGSIFSVEIPKALNTLNLGI
jgi:signal transduction histidine kinase